VVGLGAVLPHSIAGWAGGAKMIFPGCADALSIRENHALRMHPSVRRGRADGNLAREHMEAGADLVRARRYSLDVLSRPGGGVAGAVAGDPRACVRAGGARLAPAAATVAPFAADAVVVHVEGPAGRSAYQATKGFAPAAPILAPGGAVIVAARCDDGVGDLRAARRIVALGLWTTFAARARLVLASGAPAAEVRALGLEPFPTLDAALRTLGPDPGRTIVLHGALCALCALQ
jgi:nickel-dependent lactate racemase